MDPANAARIQEWDTRSASGGYRGLRQLAEAGFSGSVTTGTAWLFMLNGRIVGVADGALTSFESTDVTAYEAPDPTLPLLYAMQEHGGETRAEYYTDDHPLSEVHNTLSDAGFTGYIELSDNVLSGDYYVVYYGGKSMSAAFVGNSEKLVTGDEAFHQAAEEVGIYRVIDVELDVRDVPEPAEQDEAAEGPDPTEPAKEPGEGSASSEVIEPPEPDPDQSAGGPAARESDEPADPQPATEEATPAEPASPTPADQQAGQTEATEAAPQQPAGEEREPVESPATEDPFSQEAAWRETRTIPALDPDETDSPPTAEDGNGDQAPAEPAEVEPTQEQTVEGDRLAELEAAVEAQSSTIAELESTLESTRGETKRLREERDALQAQLDSSQQEVTESPGGTARRGKSLDPETALDQTDLFVRYNSKAGGTLEKAHDGTLHREEVVENLRIDHHTRFEEDAVTVEGRPFKSFLADSLEYRFVTWLITELLFEVQDTGSQRGLRDLFDVLPLVDRVEFQGTVTWRDPDAEETYTEAFDVICRDRMGQALIVADLNDVRDPATGGMMEDLIEGASIVAGGVETLGAAFLVTSSFFQPDALEAASEATGGGLLSREKRWSFVKLDRRHGYHLCLVEARGDDFHVAVPEL